MINRLLQRVSRPLLFRTQQRYALIFICANINAGVFTPNRMLENILLQHFFLHKVNNIAHLCVYLWVQIS